MFVLNDLRLAVRSLAARKAFSAAAVATLALGIGATTSVFAVVNAVLLGTLPVAHPEELVMFSWLRLPDPMVDSYSGYGRAGPNGTGVRTSFSYLTLERLRDQSTTLSYVFAIAPLRDAAVSADGQTAAVSADLVTGSYFDGLGVKAARGRLLTIADDRIEAEPVAVISHRYWQRRFGGDPAIVGKPIQLNRVPVTVVGVTTEGFDGIRMTETTDITIPMALASRADGATRPVSMWWLQIMARLKPDVRREQAMADVERLFDDSARDSWAARPPSSNKVGLSKPQLRITSGAQGTEGPIRDAVPVLTAMSGVTMAVLLIACVNVANLVLVRTLGRRQEIALRVALGASRGRASGHVLVESAILAVAGAASGILLVFWGRHFLEWLPGRSTLLLEARVDWRVVVFAASLSGIATILCGVGPALRATRRDLVLSMRMPALPRRGLARRATVVAQVALSLTLLALAASFLQTLFNFARVDVGFSTRNLLVARVSPAAQPADVQRTWQGFDEAMNRVRGVPGVRGATMSVVPLIARAEWSGMVGAGSNKPPTEAYIQGVGPDFFQTLEIPLLRGRDLSAADREGAPRVAVVNEALASRLFGTADPIGREFQMLDGAERGVKFQVVGVVRDTAYARLQEAAPPTFYMPYRQLSPGPMMFEIRTEREPMRLAPAIQQAIGHADRSLLVTGIQPQEQQIQETIAQPRAFALITSICSLIGVGLASVGLYGIVSFDVMRRTREIGIRMALGASQSQVIRLVLSDMTRVVAVGAMVGVVLSMAATGAARGILFGVAPGSPVATGIAVTVLTLAAAAAGYLPARRASAVDPTQALRHE
jgi:predicted permease